MKTLDRFQELQLQHLKLWCKCTKCEKTFRVPIQNIVEGKGFPPHWGKFGLAEKDPCDGEWNYYTDSFEQVLHNVLVVLNYLNTVTFYKDDSKLAELVDTVTDDLGNWACKEETPQQMGWVGQNGLP